MRLQETTLAICILVGVAGLAPGAEAARMDRQQGPVAGTASDTGAAEGQGASRLNQAHLSFASLPPSDATLPHDTSRAGRGGISCVPYARQVTGMHITGNGWEWWHKAAGSYARGQQPEPGSILAFRSTGFMRYGHVAVVSEVLGPRHLLIDHANWAGPGIRRGTVMHNVHVIDVSPENDWTDVRVQVGHDSRRFGRTYPTYGFIYNRPDRGRWIARNAEGEAVQAGYEELAEAPEPADAPRAGQYSGYRGRR